MPLILGRSGTQYVAMVTKLLSLYCGALLVQSYCKESNISDANWLRYPGGFIKGQALGKQLTLEKSDSLGTKSRHKRLWDYLGGRRSKQTRGI